MLNYRFKVIWQRSEAGLHAIQMWRQLIRNKWRALVPTSNTDTLQKHRHIVYGIILYHMIYTYNLCIPVYSTCKILAFCFDFKLGDFNCRPSSTCLGRVASFLVLLIVSYRVCIYVCMHIYFVEFRVARCCCTFFLNKKSRPWQNWTRERFKPREQREKRETEKKGRERERENEWIGPLPTKRMKIL